MEWKLEIEFAVLSEENGFGKEEAGIRGTLETDNDKDATFAYVGSILI